MRFVVVQSASKMLLFGVELLWCASQCSSIRFYLIKSNEKVIPNFVLSCSNLFPILFQPRHESYWYFRYYGPTLFYRPSIRGNSLRTTLSRFGVIEHHQRPIIPLALSTVFLQNPSGRFSRWQFIIFCDISPDRHVIDAIITTKISSYMMCCVEVRTHIISCNAS